MLRARHASEGVLPAGGPLRCLIAWARVGVSQSQQPVLPVKSMLLCSCLCSVAWAAGCGESTADFLPALLMSLQCRLGSQLFPKACSFFAFL